MQQLRADGARAVRAATPACCSHAQRPRGRQPRQSGQRQQKQLQQTRATAYEAPAPQQQRQRQPETETGGDGGGGWGWGGDGGGRPPQGGGGNNGGDHEDDSGADEPVGSPFERVAMGIRARRTADPWFFWRLAAASCADVLAVLAVNHVAQPDEPLHRSEAVASQAPTSIPEMVLVTLLNTLAVGFAMEPFSRRVRAELGVLRSDGGLAAALSPVRWPPSALGGQPGAVPLAQRLLRQGLQLGLVGLLTGLAGSAVAHQLTHWQRQKAAQGRRPPEQADAADAGVSGAGGCPGADEERPQWLRVPTDVALQRMLFMAVSANMRHAALYAAEDRLGVYAGGPARLWAVRGLLHVANSLLAAVQWRHMSHSIYPS